MSAHGAFAQLAGALRSRRTAAVALMSFASGMPLGLVWYAIPDWMRSQGIDIRVVGLLTLAQAPWSFKVLWSPLMDRFAPPRFGRRRGWAAIAQVALLALTLALSTAGNHPDAPWVVFALTLAIAFASATQDIAIDAYAVEVLRPEEQGIAVGARTAMYRAAMFLAGAFAITLTGWTSWRVTCLALAALWIPALWVTLRAPEPDVPAGSPATLRDAVWLPFLELLSRHRALEILAFVLLYKLGDNLSQSLLRPFLLDMGYDEFDRGLMLGVLGTVATVAGTFLGGSLTTVLGLGRALWVFGLLQIVSNVGYVLVASNPPSRSLMYSAMAFETLTTGLGMGAFMVLLLRLTERRFSATQYALFSSLFGIPRILAGPVTGWMVHAVGWVPFFWFTMIAGLPGLVLLARFVPWGVREPTFEIEHPRPARPLTATGLAARAALGALCGLLSSFAAVATLEALRAWRNSPEAGIPFAAAARAVLAPDSATAWISLAGVAVFTVGCGLFAAAVAAARRRPVSRPTCDTPS